MLAVEGANSEEKNRQDIARQKELYEQGKAFRPATDSNMLMMMTMIDDDDDVNVVMFLTAYVPVWYLRSRG